MKFFDKDIIFIRKLIIVILVAIIILMMIFGRFNFRNTRYFTINDKIASSVMLGNININT
jgi:hypothetical protein